jgi:hypothetical protein
VIGGGWAGHIKEAGFKGEMSYFIPRKDSFDSYESFSASVMVDQTYKNDWYVSLTGLYNSNPSNYFVFSDTTTPNIILTAKELFPFRYNFYVTATKTISPISSFTFSIMYSPEKNTTILVPVYAWNVAENFDIDLTIQSYFAEQTDGFSNVITQTFIRGRWNF